MEFPIDLEDEWQCIESDSDGDNDMVSEEEAKVKWDGFNYEQSLRISLV